MNANTSYKNPPALDTDKPYETWKSEIEIWKLVTEIKKEKQALAIVSSLSGQARQKALEISVTDLNQTTGVDKLIAELDGIFLKDKVDLAYEAYTRFELFKKAATMSMTDYIV